MAGLSTHGGSGRRVDERANCSVYARAARRRTELASAIVRVAAPLMAYFLVAAVPSLHAAISNTGAMQDRTLTFVTYNLFHGGPSSGLLGNAHDLDQRLDIVAEELGNLGADVVALQEASAGFRRGSVAERLATRLGFHHVYAPANPRIFGSDVASHMVAGLLNFSEGPAIVSRFPIVTSHGYELPRCGKLFERRMLLSATVESPWGHVRVFSAHTLGDVCQTQVVAKIVRLARNRLPEMLMGDFNASEESPAIAALARQPGFLDAFRTANPTQPGFSVWQQMNVTTPTVRRRVDYLFLVAGTEVPGSVLSSRLVLNAPRLLGDRKPLWPSDHYGVLAEVDIAPPTNPAPSSK